MPNWCYNRITVYGDEKTEAKLKEIEEIFEKENPFNEILPIPDFKNIPNEKGELPNRTVKYRPDGSIFYETYDFSDGKNDDRWYHWCVENWGTKWDACDKSVEYEDSEILACLLYTSPSPRDGLLSRMPSSA